MSMHVSKGSLWAETCKALYCVQCSLTSVRIASLEGRIAMINLFGQHFFFVKEKICKKRGSKKSKRVMDRLKGGQYINQVMTLNLLDFVTIEALKEMIDHQGTVIRFDIANNAWHPVADKLFLCLLVALF